MSFGTAWKSIVSFLLLVTPTCYAEDGPRILDLSQPFSEDKIYDQDQAYLESFLERDIRRFLVIDDGEIVMDYQRDNVADDELFNLWSATKSVMSCIIGTILTSDQYDLSLEDTLGDIFTGENDWGQVVDPEELAFKQNVTLFELLTFTSGLTDGDNLDFLTVDYFDPLDLETSLGKTIANSAGTNLTDTLADHGWDPALKGTAEYLQISNLYSYIVEVVTGMSPLEYASVDLLPSLGINPDEIQWDKNDDGIETSLSNLKMTAKQMAKFGQLYLQKGKAAPDNELLSSEFVQDSLDPKFFIEKFGLMYGYLWLHFDYNNTVYPSQDEYWCANGFLGQLICLNYETNRVGVLQRSNTVYDMENANTIRYGVMAFALSKNVTFDVPVVEEPEISSEISSGGVSLVLASGAGMAAAAISCLAVWL